MAQSVDRSLSQRSGHFTVGALLFVASIGCTPPPPAVTVIDGKLTFEGKPLPGATVVWNSAKGPVASGNVDTDGVYHIDNALVGPGVFTILPPQKQDLATLGQSARTTVLAADKSKKLKVADPSPKTDVSLPARYLHINTSGLPDTLGRDPHIKNFDLRVKMVN